jgi:hypothetical protein
MQHRDLLLAVTGFAVLAATGCGGTPAAVRVSGSVRTTDGAPLAEGQLVLIPDPFDEDQPQAGATLAEDGSFTCRLFTGTDGVLPGRYKVILRFPTGKGSVNPLTRTYSRYTKLETTPLSLDVPDSGRNDIVFELELPDGSSGE